MKRAPRSALLAASIFLLAWPLALYPAVLWLIARVRPRRAASEGGGMRSLAVIVPTWRERANIEARLRNILDCEYPRDLLEILVVDSASDDGTADAAEAWAAAHPGAPVRVLREARRAGKAAATNFALTQTRADLVLVTDAPTRFHPQALARIVRAFDDPQVGAATGEFHVFEERTATQREEGLFWRIRHLLRTLEAEVDSTPFLSGEFCCFRRALIAHIDTDSIADDMNVALQVRRQGYRAVIQPDVLFTEPRSPDVGDLLVRKVSRAAGGVQELLRHRDMLLRPRYGLFGMLILPSDLLYYVPLRIPALAVVARALPGLPRGAKIAGAALAGIALVAPGMRRRLIDALYVSFLNEWLFLRGWQTVLAKQTEVLWDKESRAVVPDSGWQAAADGRPAAAPGGA
jgi:cellulose synthase/poly-beta-1,6-N-acetylglucosamine synthase-like glycosyltransferase